MICCKINGKNVNLADNTNIQKYLQSQNYHAERVAVEQNGAIVPKSEYAGRIIKAGDMLEIVAFVGGG